MASAHPFLYIVFKFLLPSFLFYFFFKQLSFPLWPVSDSNFCFIPLGRSQPSWYLSGSIHSAFLLFVFTSLNQIIQLLADNACKSSSTVSIGPVKMVFDVIKSVIPKYADITSSLWYKIQGPWEPRTLGNGTILLSTLGELHCCKHLFASLMILNSCCMYVPRGNKTAAMLAAATSCLCLQLK